MIQSEKDRVPKKVVKLVHLTETQLFELKLRLIGFNAGC
jgi:hypothetical protein